jgi:hypothetical protein
MSAEEIAALSPAADDGDDQPVGRPQLSPEAARAPHEQVQIAPVRPPLLPAPVRTERAEPTPEGESPEVAAERERRYREIFGIPEPKTPRRWRR